MFKRFSFLFILALSLCNIVFSQTPQAKKPTIMVVPSDIWCIKSGYFQSYGNDKVPDYKVALSNSRDINLVITQMGKMMAERGFPLQDLQSTLSSIASDDFEMSLITGGTSGEGITETDLEKYNRTAKADIIISVDVATERRGPKTYTTFNVRALDSYTNKQISGVQGGGNETSAPIEAQLNTAICNYMDSFTAQLQTHFNELFSIGREITVTLMKFNSSYIDFESEFDYNGQEAELGEIIAVWFEDNTVNQRFSVATQSKNRMVFNQVRMPLMGKSLSGREVAIDATAFVRPLVNMLKKEPYNCPVKVHQKGLGEVWLVLGEK